MKFKITKLAKNEDYRGGIKFSLLTEISGVEEVKSRFIDGGEPEDNSLGRDWSDVYDIEKLVILAHEAGKRGELLEITKEEQSYNDF